VLKERTNPVVINLVKTHDGYKITENNEEEEEKVKINKKHYSDLLK